MVDRGRYFVGLWIALACCTQSHEVGGDIARVLVDAAVPVPPADDSGPLCSRVAAVQCEGEQRCCGRTTRSRERCQAELAQACADNAFLDQIAANPASGYDARASDRAFTELARRTALCDPSVPQWAATDQGLRSMFRGTLSNAESCNPADGLTDLAGVATALTTCRTEEGLACLPSSGLFGTFSCAPKQAIGELCLTDDNCQSVDVCDNFGEPVVGNCAARLPLGAACENSAQCVSLHCDDAVCAEITVDRVYCPT